MVKNLDTALYMVLHDLGVFKANEDQNGVVRAEVCGSGASSFYSRLDQGGDFGYSW